MTKKNPKKVKRAFSGRCMLFLLLLFTAVFPSQSFAQGFTVKGKVTDSQGIGIPGVNVLIKGSANGRATDIDGNYVIQVDGKEGILQFSFIGYITKEEKVNGRSVIDVQLREDSQALDEVVVVGYGTQKKATVTGSVATVKGDVLKSSGAANLSNAIAGTMPGVIAVNRSGEPGADWSSILIRGKGSLNDNSPLWVIDGVANRSGFDRLNPSDIESMTVLKDASAAIYGAQAANGVILVTTKKGISSKPTVTYDGSFGISQNTRTPNLMNAYEWMVYDDEIKGYLGEKKLWENIKGGYLDRTINRKQYGDTDWMDVIFSKAAPQTKHSLSVRGGNEDVKYYVSGAYSYQKPNYNDTKFNFQTAQIRSNIDAKINRDLNLNLELSGRQETRNNPPYGSGTIFWEAAQAYPYLYDYYPNGLPGPGIQNGNNLALLTSGKGIGYNRTKDLFLNSKIGFDLKMPWITQGLSFSGYVAFDMNYRNQKQFWDVFDTYTYNPNTDSYDKQTTNPDMGCINLNQSSSNWTSTTIHWKLGYDRQFGEHNIGAFFAYEQNKTVGEDLWGWRGYYMSNKIDYLFAGADREKNNGGSGYTTARQNIFGRVSYSFMNRYMAEFTLRYDGSQNFAKAGRWGTFPGVSVGWRLSEESFIRNNADFIDELKLRASWGKLGNDRSYDANGNPVYFQYLSTYNVADGGIFGMDPEQGKGFVPGRVGNPNITWEKVDTKNIGLEGLFWNGLLGFSFEYFFQKRTDILTPKQASFPDYTGLILPDQNIGEVNNQGVEIMLNHRNTLGNWTYYVGGNMTFTRNKIIYFDEAQNVPAWQKRTNHSIDSWLMYKTDGIYQSWDEINSTPHLADAQPGDIKYVDIDESGDITSNDMVRDYSSNVPEIVYGINMGFSWKGLELNMLWTGQANATQMIVPYGFNVDKEYYKHRWISAEETPHSKYPRAFNKDDKVNTKWSDFWLYDASFIRLKNLEIAYTLPKAWLDKIGIQNFRVYVTGNNLLTFDKIKVQDPESNATGTGQYFPQQRVYTVGVNVSF